MSMVTLNEPIGRLLTVQRAFNGMCLIMVPPIKEEFVNARSM